MGNGTFGGTQYHLRYYQETASPEKPCFVLQEFQDNPGPSLGTNRVALAEGQAKALGTTPDQVQWYEIQRDGAIREYTFHPHEHTLRPYASDLSYAEYTAAERNGEQQPQQGRSYTVSSQEVSREALEARVGERLPGPQTNVEHAVQQNQEFREWSHSGVRPEHRQDLEPER